MSSDMNRKKLDGQDLQLLEKKVEDAKKVIRDAFEKYGPETLRIAWTGGKDSTLVLWLAREVCLEMGADLPKCFNINEGDMFNEIIEFIDTIKADWGAQIVHIHNDDVSKAAGGVLGAAVQVEDLNERNRREIERLGYEEDEFDYEPESFVGNHLMKTVTMNKYLEDEQTAGIFIGVRWDEQEARSNEEYFNLHEATDYNPEHMRIHPILHFTEHDVWDAHFQYDIPICKLYLEGYRSLGAKVTTSKTSDAPAWEQDLDSTYERGGRRQDKEELMAKLRKLGYM
jgi:phosphoadenosine phosphosulfate reductase